jgi:phospholipase/carboxylesterase
MSSLPSLSGPEVAPASGGAPRQIVILVHGYGSNGQDLIGLVPYWRAALPDAVFISPNAPERCPGAPGGFQWWALSTLSPPERSEGVRRAAPVLDAFIDQQLNRFGLGEDKLALVGFSQGTMMSLHVAPRRERQIAGVVGFSGMLADPSAPTAELKSRPPVLLTHGDADPVLPIAFFHEAKASLEQLGFDVTSHVSRGLGHSIDMDGLRLGQTFLTRIFR